MLLFSLDPECRLAPALARDLDEPVARHEDRRFEHGADRVTAVVPYLACAPKDRQTKPFDPVGLRCVAQLFEAVGTDRMIVLEAHNVAALQNAFRCTCIHRDAWRLFDAAIGEIGSAALTVASPAPGSSPFTQTRARSRTAAKSAP